MHAYSTLFFFYVSVVSHTPLWTDLDVLYDHNYFCVADLSHFQNKLGTRYSDQPKEACKFHVLSASVLVVEELGFGMSCHVELRERLLVISRRRKESRKCQCSSVSAASSCLLLI